ncbi:hypothetical protein [Nitrosopumilus sp.]|uniref:hypothetical protein n=1 Tax=Nitrosopumilus sp. TaxID=2024843 RepID=UPI003D09A6B4
MQKEERISIDAILKDDVLEYLTQLDLKEDFEAGKIKCNSCEDIVTFENIGIIFFEEHIPKIVCNKPYCYQNVPITR